MRGRAVVALLVILDREFPVCRNCIILVRGNLEVRKIEHRHRFGQVFFAVLQRRRRIGKRDEYQAMDRIHGYGMQAVAIPIEVLWHVPGGNQFAIGVVHPAVIRAGKLVCVALFLEAYERAAMSADVRKRLDTTVFAANDDRGFTGNVEHLEVARLGQLRLMPCEYPVAGYDSLEFQLVDFRVRVKTLIQRIPGLLCCNQLFNRPRIIVVHYRAHRANVPLVQERKDITAN